MVWMALNDMMTSVSLKTPVASGAIASLNIHV